MSAALGDLRLRSPSSELLALPWLAPLAEWDPTDVPFRDIPVGPSRHLVRFVGLQDGLYAVKEAPDRTVEREYAVLRRLEAQRLPAVRPVGVVLRGEERGGLLVTRFLERSWQYRRLFMRLPQDSAKQRDRLLAGMASLMVELHRAGVFWGDCSLANTLFVRDGQVLQACLVDAETSEIHARLSDGQRRHDLDILVENVTGGLIDIAYRLGATDDLSEHMAAAEGVAETYEALWEELHRDMTVSLDERWRVDRYLRRLNELGYAVEELRLEPGPDGDKLRVGVAVAARDYHAEQLRALTGLSVGEGQATVLLNDLHAYSGALAPDVDARTAGWRWRRDVFGRGVALVGELGDLYSDPVQAFCDLLEVRWLLSEQAGRDVGDEAALAALRAGQTPSDSAAALAVLEVPTGEYNLPS